MIPKIIHFCWLSGDPYPELISACINSWKQYLPNYEIILWDTNKINIESNPWLKEAYENKKYAFAADFIRFYALHNYGGIYLDADVEVLKPFDDLLNCDSFIGFEIGGDFEAAVIGAVKGSKWIEECLNYYNKRNFIKPNGEFDMRPVPLLINSVISNNAPIRLIHNKKYVINNINIYPYYFFSPKNFFSKKIDLKEETYCIHHFDGKWITYNTKTKLKFLFHRLVIGLIGQRLHNYLISFIRKYT